MIFYHLRSALAELCLRPTWGLAPVLLELTPTWGFLLRRGFLSSGHYGAYMEKYLFPLINVGLHGGTSVLRLTWGFCLPWRSHASGHIGLDSIIRVLYIHIPTWGIEVYHLTRRYHASDSYDVGLKLKITSETGVSLHVIYVGLYNQQTKSEG